MALPAFTRAADPGFGNVAPKAEGWGLTGRRGRGPGLAEPERAGPIFKRCERECRELCASAAGFRVRGDCGGGGGDGGGGGGDPPSPDGEEAGGAEQHPGVPTPGGVAYGSWPKERVPRAAPQRGCCLQASSKLVNARPR